MCHFFLNQNSNQQTKLKIKDLKFLEKVINTINNRVVGLTNNNLFSGRLVYYLVISLRKKKDSGMVFLVMYVEQFLCSSIII